MYYYYHYYAKHTLPVVKHLRLRDGEPERLPWSLALALRFVPRCGDSRSILDTFCPSGRVSRAAVHILLRCGNLGGVMSTFCPSGRLFCPAVRILLRCGNLGFFTCVSCFPGRPCLPVLGFSSPSTSFWPTIGCMSACRNCY